MCLALEDMGLTTEVHHHEVATAGQCEIGVQFSTLVHKADEVQILKYVVHNVAKLATDREIVFAEGGNLWILTNGLAWNLVE